MKQLVFSPVALRDIEGIWDYTLEHWGLKQAERYTDTIQNDCLKIAQGKAVHCARVYEREGYSKYQTGMHFIYYRSTDTKIEVMRILHQRMDPNQYLLI